MLTVVKHILIIPGFYLLFNLNIGWYRIEYPFLVMRLPGAILT